MLKRAVWAAAMLGSAIPTEIWAQGATVAGGVDLRASTLDGATGRLEGAFLNYRQVIVADGVDRWIVVAQADSGTNADHPHLYQSYLQYKGPLGRWNAVAGRFIVPFGLLATYDSERQLLTTIEALSTGIKLAQGAELHGFRGDGTYALALTTAPGGRGAVVTGRLARNWDGGNMGISLLSGLLPETTTKESLERVNSILDNVQVVAKRRLAVDATLQNGPDLVRSELIAGTDDGRFVKGAYLNYERSLNAAWTLGADVGFWAGSSARRRYGLALSRSFDNSVVLRTAYVNADDAEGKSHQLLVQLYWEFSHAL
ncbi:hypothetical protein [Massilia putida]|uniref:hypothetical protein n=1 Tax=Massilia putida TaxID=1141883 RepID=UPI0009524D4F|nr:hypothetical protein [Massilia putida]